MVTSSRFLNCAAIDCVASDLENVYICIYIYIYREREGGERERERDRESRSALKYEMVI